MSKTRKLKIAFQVQEVLPEGEDQEQARYITFGDEVLPSQVKDFFVRAGYSVATIFGASGPHVLRLNRGCRWTKKIQAIKEIRMLTGLGLREAKQAAEAHDGVFLVTQDEGAAALLRERFAAFTSSPDHVIIEPVDLTTAMRQAPGTPILTKKARDELSV